MTPRYKRKLVTPQLAEKWLKNNEGNRPCRPMHVGNLAGALRRGEYIENGDPIMFAPDDTLLNGQHRLMAIVQSGVSVWMLIARNVPPETMQVIDTGKARSGADALKVHGVGGPVHQVAAVARMHMTFEATGDPRGQGVQFTNVQVVAFVDNNPYAVESAKFATQRANRTPLFPRGYIGWLHFAIGEGKQHEAIDFFHGIITGEDLGKTDPRRFVREWIIRNGTTDDTRTFRDRKMYLLCKSWILWREGKPATRISMTSKDLEPATRREAVYANI